LANLSVSFCAIGCVRMMSARELQASAHQIYVEHPVDANEIRGMKGVSETDREPERCLYRACFQIAFLSPMIGTIAAGWAVSLTTFAAVVGRIAAGFVVDRCNRRVVAFLNFVMQALGIAILAAATERPMLYLGCLLFGAGVGNAASLPGLIVQQEFPKQHFARIVSLVVAINQFSFAFGPSLLAQLQHASGGYTVALLVCLAAEIVAAIVVLLPGVIQRRAAV
jgi:MFS family permease